MFSYSDFTTRNLGFVTEAEQLKLQSSCIFFPGVGGMGGTALECLARTGIGQFIVADIDVFEVSNLNRQIFSDLKVIGESKAEVAKSKLLLINPELKIEVLGKEWIEKLPEILRTILEMARWRSSHLTWSNGAAVNLQRLLSDPLAQAKAETLKP